MCGLMSLTSHILTPYYAAPERLNPVVDIDEDDPEEITIRWTLSSGVLRYILEVRQFVAGGPGKEKIKTIDGYPRELSGVVLGHTVTNMSKILSCQSLLQLPYLSLTPPSLSLCSWRDTIPVHTGSWKHTWLWTSL